MERLELGTRLPVLSWCPELEPGVLAQARNLADHPAVFRHVALMPDAHQGFGMPIGGVIACQDAVIPNAVGVDIGCGMAAVRSSLPAEDAQDKARLRAFIATVRGRIPLGEGRARREALPWDGFERWRDSLGTAALPEWHTHHGDELDRLNLGSLGGGNHFIEAQAGDDGLCWLMLHSGSRNLGYRIAAAYQKIALALDARLGFKLPDPELAWLPLGSAEADAYLRDMAHALAYAAENRRVMLVLVEDAFAKAFPGASFAEEISIHHNYAAQETHFGRAVWVHRKGATAARAGLKGIIPGSMGTASYIVEGQGCADSFQSCSHGAGRRMGRNDACRRLSQADCDRAMAGVVREDWKPSSVRGPDGRKLPDLSEAPGAYKDIDGVMAAQAELARPLVRLRPLAVLKG